MQVAVLPPPCHYDDSFSYQSQWQQYNSSCCSTTANATTSDFGNDDDGGGNLVIFDLCWWSAAADCDGDNGDWTTGDDGDDNLVFLVACTGQGEIVIWRAPPLILTTQDSDDDNDDDDDDDDYGAAVMDADNDNDTDDDSAISGTRRGRKRQRRRSSSRSELSKFAKPLFRTAVSSGSLYAIEIVVANHRDDKTLLIIGGDDGILVYDWKKDILEKILLPLLAEEKKKEGDDEDGDIRSDDTADKKKKKKSSQLGGTVSSVYDGFSLREMTMIPVLCRLGPYKYNCASPYSSSSIHHYNNNNVHLGAEVNDVRFNDHYIYGVAGECCHKWDLNRGGGGGGGELVSTYHCSSSSSGTTSTRNNRSGSSCSNHYLHCLDLVRSENLLLTGGEEGNLYLWDYKKDQRVECIDLATASSVASSSGGGTSGKNTSQAKNISSLAVHEGDNWWTIAGGMVSGNHQHNSGNSSCGGFLSTWHAPTRSMVAVAETRERPQKVLEYNADRMKKSSRSRSRSSSTGGDEGGDDDDCDFYSYLGGGTSGRAATGDHFLLSLANESVVSYWDPLSLERTRRIPAAAAAAASSRFSSSSRYLYGYSSNTSTTATSSSRRSGAAAAFAGPFAFKSGYAGDVCNADGRIAVAGVGPVHILERGGTEQTFRFSL